MFPFHVMSGKDVRAVIDASRPEIFRPELVDDVVLVAEADTVRTCRWLARRHGLFAGGSTGSVVYAALRRAPELPEGSLVVAISPDLGDRYARTVYDDAWVADTFGPDCLAHGATHPTELATARS